MRLIHTDRQVEVLVDASVAQGFPVIEYAFPGGTESCEARTVTTAHASWEPEDILIRWGS